MEYAQLCWAGGTHRPYVGAHHLDGPGMVLCLTHRYAFHLQKVKLGLIISGIMFSISRSKLALPTQLVFLVLNGLGVVFGTIYNVKTPDLYHNNAHHTIGWVATWVMTAQVVMSLIFVYSGRQVVTPAGQQGERAAFLPVSVEAIAQYNTRPYSDYRWSGDSGQGTERSSLQNSRDVSPTDPSRRDSLGPYSKPEAELDEEDNELEMVTEPRGFWRNNFAHGYLSRRLPGMFSERLLKTVELLYRVIDRTSLILGFIAFTTGGVTYAGIFVSLPRIISPLCRAWLTFLTAITERFQWPCTLCERRNLLLVWVAEPWKMDGLLCRLGLGMERQA